MSQNRDRRDRIRIIRIQIVLLLRRRNIVTKQTSSPVLRVRRQSEWCSQKFISWRSFSGSFRHRDVGAQEDIRKQDRDGNSPLLSS